MRIQGTNSLAVLVLGARLFAAPAEAASQSSTETGTAAEALSPDALRARERAVLLVLQSVLGAEKLYASANGTYFDELNCLMQPWTCIPGFAADGAPFLDPTFDWLKPDLDHQRTFHPGPRATADEIARAKASPTSLKAFAFTIVPLKPGVTGQRAFCGDSRGRLCVRDDGLQPPVKDGQCDPCKKLQ